MIPIGNTLRGLRWLVQRRLYGAQNEIFTRTWDKIVTEDTRFSETEGMQLPSSEELLDGATIAFEEFFHSLNAAAGEEKLKKMCSRELYAKLEPEIVGKSDEWLAAQENTKKCIFHSIETALLGVALPGDLAEGMLGEMDPLNDAAPAASAPDAPAEDVERAKASAVESEAATEAAAGVVQSEVEAPVAAAEDAAEEVTAKSATAEPTQEDLESEFDILVRVGYIAEFSTQETDAEAEVDEDEDEARYFRSDVLEFGAKWDPVGGMGDFVVFNIS